LVKAPLFELLSNFAQFQIVKRKTSHAVEELGDQHVIQSQLPRTERRFMFKTPCGQRPDWRYRMISDLISPRNNPEFHWIPSLGITIAGLLLIPFIGYIHRRLHLALHSSQLSGLSHFSAAPPYSF
jgi:hypothetical protein